MIVSSQAGAGAGLLSLDCSCPLGCITASAPAMIDSEASLSFVPNDCKRESSVMDCEQMLYVMLWCGGEAWEAWEEGDRHGSEVEVVESGGDRRSGGESV